MENRKRRRFWTIAAASLVCCLVVISAVYVLAGSWETATSGLRAVVEQEGVVTYEALLQDENGIAIHADEQLSFKGKAGEYIVEIKDGKVRMLSSHCPDKVCANEGWTDQPARSIICLPQKVIISVERLKTSRGSSEVLDPDALSK